MNTSETPVTEKPKRKSKPRVDRYSQNEAFAVMILAFGYTLFFWLDDLLGAVDFEPIENKVAFVYAVLVPGLIMLIYHRWHGTLKFRAWVESIVLVGVCAVVSPFLGLVQIFSFLIPMALPLEALVGIYFGVICFVVAIRFMGLRPIPRVHDIPTYAILIFAMFYGLGASWHGFFGYDIFGQELTRTHNYILIVNYDFDDPEEAILYECNPYSFGCQNIYSQSTYADFVANEPPYSDPRWPKTTLQLIKGEYDNVLVLVDGEVVFDSSEGGEE